jgi:diphthine synthase
LGELIFVGLGLFDQNDLSLRGLQEAETAEFVYAEFYTSLMAGISLTSLEGKIGKKVKVVPRHVMEDENGEQILEKALRAKVVFLVPGDPMTATTHVDLRIRAEKRGIKTRIVHGASIVSAVTGLSGLQNYKFGRSVTIPFSENSGISETPYEVLGENKARNLHTLCFLDIKAEKQKYMTINEALKIALAMEERGKKGVVGLDSLAVGIARAGAEDVKVKADSIKNLMDFQFGGPPHVLVFPAPRLHFVEAKALITFADAPMWVRRMVG